MKSILIMAGALMSYSVAASADVCTLMSPAKESPGFFNTITINRPYKGSISIGEYNVTLNQTRSGSYKVRWDAGNADIEVILDYDADGSMAMAVTTSSEQITGDYFCKK